MAELSWSTRDGSRPDFYRLAERRGGDRFVSYVAGERLVLSRAVPGRYEFEIHACVRGADETPSCGRKSRKAIVEVSDAVLVESPDAAEQRQRRRAGETPIDAGRDGPETLRPGLWYNPDRNGHGWSFYWNNRLSLPESDEQFGAAWDLTGTWYTYEAKTRFLDGPPPCGEGGFGTECYWVYENYRPIAARLNLVRTAESSYEGSIVVRRSGVDIHVGSAEVIFGTGNTTAEIQWSADFRWQALQGADALVMLAGSQSAQTTGDSHLSGVWRSGSNPGHEVVATLGAFSESMEVLFPDAAGDPAWVQASNPWPPSSGGTPLCFYYVLNGYAPSEQGQTGIHTDGCNLSSDASETNRNGERRFAGFETLNLWARFDLPASAGGGQLAIGSAASPAVLAKTSGLHRVFLGPDGGGCEIAAGQSACGVRLGWFTSGDYPRASVFGLHLQSGDRLLLATAATPVVQDFTVLLDREGSWQFELRMGDAPDSSLMAVSGTIEVRRAALQAPGKPAAAWLDPEALAWRVSWNHPAPQTVGRYELEETLPGAAAPVTHSIQTGNVMHRDFARPEGPWGEYRYRVRACSDGGCSGWSGLVSWNLSAPPGGGGGHGELFHPWQEQASTAGSLVTGVNYHYAMGYHFRPDVDGIVTELGGFFQGNKQVKLFERTSQRLLASAWVSSNNDWSYAPIAAVPVSADVDYTVAVYLAGSGGSYRSSPSLPSSSGSIDILASAYRYTNGNPDAFPSSSTTTRMYGQADIGFRAEEAPPPANQPPELTPPVDQVTLIGDPVILELEATDPEGDALTCSFSGLPPGLVGSGDCRVTGSPTGPAGLYSVSAIASDGQAQSEPASFAWEIRDRGTPASPESPPPPAARPDFGLDATSVGVGLTAGESRVDERGGFHYRVPLRVAPGSGGFAPDLALEYHSQAPNDVAGVGWSIGGLSAITRCPQTVEQDGVSANRPVQLDAGDRYCLDGQRLMVVVGGYGQDGAEYRTERDELLKIVSHGWVDGGPAWFTVRHGDGGFSEYGRREDARVESRGPGVARATLAWALSRRQDAASNYIDFEYEKATEGPVEAVLARVRYTGNQRVNLPPWAEMRFHYDDGRTDVPVRFIHGVAIQRSRLLRRIESLAAVSAGQSAYASLRHYRLDYGQDGHGRPVLESIEECSDATRRYCFPPTRFGWLKSEHGIAAGGVSVGSVFDRQLRGLGVADVNGDARPDLLVVQKQRNSLEYRVALAGADGNFELRSERYAIPDDGDKESPVRLLTADLDGDGLQDVLYPKLKGSTIAWVARFSDGTALGEETIVVADCCGQSKPAVARILDFDGDGRPDLLTSRETEAVPGRGELVVLINSGGKSSGTTFLPPRVLSIDYDHGLFPEGPTADGWLLNADAPQFRDVVAGSAVGATPVDFNGDGRVDLLARIGRHYERCVNDCIINDAADQPSAGQAFEIRAEGESAPDFVPDGTERASVNLYILFEAEGDGRYVQKAVIATGAGLDCGVPEACQPWSQLPAVQQMLPVDVNADGIADFAHRDADEAWWYRLSTGTGLDGPEPVAPAADPALSGRAQFIDLSGDGAPEFLLPDRSGDDAAQWQMYPNDRGSGYGAAMLTGIRAGDSGEGDLSILLDFTGDGLLDHLFLDFEKGQPSAAGTKLHPGQNLLTGETGEAGNLLDSVTGSAGAVTRVHYAPLTDPAVYSPFRDAPELAWGRGSAVFDLLAPVYVVRSVERSAPSFENDASMQQLAYRYAGGKIQAGGRGFLGFAEVVTWDPQLGLRSHARYRQDFPLTGAVVESAVFLSPADEGFALMGPARAASAASVTADTEPPPSPGASTLLSYTQNTWVQRESAAGAGAWWRAPAETIFRSYTLQGSLAKKDFTQRRHDSHGREERNVVSTWAGDDTPVFSQITTERNYLAPDVSRWQLGQLAAISVRHERLGLQAVTRRSSFAYEADSGLLVREVTEPGDAVLQVTSEHALDGWGNRVRTSVIGVGMAPRNSEVRYDALGRFPVELRNHYGQVTSRTQAWDALGTPLNVVDINGVRTETATDPLGQAYVQWNEAGSWRRTRRSWGPGSDCPAVAAFHERQQGGGAPDTFRCLDRLGREIRVGRTGFDGRLVYEDRDHDRSGRLVRSSEPYFAGDQRYWNLVEYDTLSRPTRMLSSGGDQVIQRYANQVGGRCGVVGPGAVSTQNALGQVRVEVRNPAGEVTSVYDATCGRTTFEHDAIGNLVRVIGPDGVSSTMQYDVAGRKTAMQDPGKGDWRYRWNALGELTRQLDAKGQATDFEYDSLGRVVRRTEIAGVSGPTDTGGRPINEERTEWQNGTSSQVRGKAQAAAAIYRSLEDGSLLQAVDWLYDEFGRREMETSEQGGMQFVREWTYDQFGRTFQEFDASGDFRGLRHVYTASGYPAQWRESREGSQGLVYREILEMDARGRVLHAQLGNGVETFAEYASAGGELESLHAYDRSGVQLQDLDYVFDMLGNLVQRVDRSNGIDVTEDFQYDDLNRLTSVRRTAPAEGLSSPTEQLSVQYTAGGNIAWKSDVGSYLYGQDGAGEHAVTMAGGVHYTYDPNGNQVAGDGREIVYTAFDKPSSIQRGDHSTEFFYGVGQRRIQRVDDNPVDGVRATHYVGQVELLEDAHGLRFRRYLAGAVVAEYFPATGESLYRYLVSDHLGSPHVISAEDGAVGGAQWLGHDAFGQRREARGGGLLGLAALNAINAVTPRGFTGHEHVDGLGLIHMNGRIYDPRLGRFLQADPYLPDTPGSQSLNRYSYALNNPLGYSDPSGYFLKRFLKRWGRLIVAIALSVVLPGPQGLLATYLGVGNVYLQAAITGFVAGAVASGTLQGAVIGSIAALAVTGVVQAFANTKSDLGLASTVDLAPESEEIIRLYGPDGPPAGLYRIEVRANGGLVSHSAISESSIIAGNKVVSNGMLNDYADAIRNATSHLYQAGQLPDSYVLYFNPTKGIFPDIGEALVDVIGAHFGGAHSTLARNLAETLNALSERGVTGIQLLGHSQGGAIAASALRYASASGLNLSSLSGGGLSLHGAPVNAWLTRRQITGPAGIGLVSRAQFGDAVHVLGGLNISNPLELPVAILRFPSLFSSDPGLSPHTLPCGGRSVVCAP